MKTGGLAGRVALVTGAGMGIGRATALALAEIARTMERPTTPKRSLLFAVWMIRGFFQTIPEEVDEAAQVDGCNRLQILLRIGVPLVVPGLLAVGFFSFLNSWNNLIFALSLTTQQSLRTIPPGFLLTYVGEFQYQWSSMFAGSVLVTLPTIVIFIALQRFLVKGLVAGATK